MAHERIEGRIAGIADGSVTTVSPLQYATDVRVLLDELAELRGDRPAPVGVVSSVTRQLTIEHWGPSSQHPAHINAIHDLSELRPW